ncbi:alcohol dehydrogenase [Megasphaera cerevisiae DSM 20462]|jgi:L-iditol 2-dehydrogenase|uniref:Alcohol dehydrogenase n=1 Tax=Megasphaera cerevisiae DSM 20462 TaxID=1122219 RepID=A0A0J6WWB8_9FIRM|nr:zinc-dependent dehydrogenase [Megasphaera cerevisiae]KMO87825.1 alcohol dehydrogenase [Megasphaera cerevisiae DSM 20462]OKY54388.1 alcohol dehydrogenase [Megasphaera cerevisiae]SJZ50389.1 L-iditol 2-dehydrogenase [Megasphaera cerevisiae DSM 20462]
MKAAIYKDIGNIVIEEIKTPHAGAGELLVQVKACAICGGDLRTFRYGHQAIHPPMVLGHETSGVVVEVGTGIDRYAVGDRVIVAPGIGCGHCSYCLSGNQHLCYHRRTIAHHYNGGFAEYVLIPAIAVQAGNVNFIPTETDYLSASLAEPLACVINGQEAMHIQLGDTVAVIGAGPIGLMHAELAKASGAGKVFLINRSAARLESAKPLGYDGYINSGSCDAVQAVEELTGGRGANVVIVTVGSAAAQRMGMQMASKMGKVCLFAGLPKDSPMVELDANRIHYRQIALYGTFSSAPRHNALAIEMIRSGKINVDQILTHVVSLDDICYGIKLVENRAGLRVAVAPHLEDIQKDIAKHEKLIVARP